MCGRYPLTAPALGVAVGMAIVGRLASIDTQAPSGMLGIAKCAGGHCLIIGNGNRTNKKGHTTPRVACSYDNRGDKTPLELFLSGVQGVPATIRAILCQAATG